MKMRIVVDVEIDRPFEGAEQERYFLATLEEAISTEVWHDLLANEKEAPQRVTCANARFHR